MKNWLWEKALGLLNMEMRKKMEDFTFVFKRVTACSNSLTNPRI